MSSEKKRVPKGRAWSWVEENTVLDLMRTQVNAENEGTTSELERDDFWRLIANQLFASNDTFSRTPDAIRERFASRLGREYSPNSSKEKKIKIEDGIDSPNLNIAPLSMNDSSKAKGNSKAKDNSSEKDNSKTKEKVGAVNSAGTTDGSLSQLLSPDLLHLVEKQFRQEAVTKDDRAQPTKPTRKINSETARQPVWDPSKPGSSWSFVDSVPDNQAQSKPPSKKTISKSASPAHWSPQEQQFIKSQLDKNPRPAEEGFQDWTKKLDDKTLPQVKDDFRRMQHKRQTQSDPESGTLASSSAPSSTKRKNASVSGSLNDSRIIPDSQRSQPPAKKPRSDIAPLVAIAKPTELVLSPTPALGRVKRVAPVRDGFTPVNQAKNPTNTQALKSSTESERFTPLQKAGTTSINGSKANIEKMLCPATTSINGSRSNIEKAPLPATTLINGSKPNTEKTPINQSIGDVQALTTPKNGVIELTEDIFNQFSAHKIQNHDADIAKTEEAKEAERENIVKYRAAIKISEENIKKLDADIAQQQRLKAPIVTMLKEREALLLKGKET